MSALYAIRESIVGKSIRGVIGLALNPIVSGGLLAFLEKGPQHVIEDILARAGLPANYDLTTVKLALAVLLVIGGASALNKKLNSMAANSWRIGGAPGWDWPKEIAVVTGGSSGIGLAIARELLTKNVKVAIFDIQPPPKDLQSNKLVKFYKCDATSSASLAEAADGVRKDFGNPTILVNNAGIAKPANILTIPEKDLERIFRINTMCHWLTVQQFGKAMVKANKGHIITIASVASFVGMPGHADYGATKASALAFHEALHAELAHTYNAPNVLTTIVHPDFVATPLLTEFKSNLDSNGIRYITPEQVAQVTCANVFGTKGGQVIVPEQSAGASFLRSAPNWLQISVRNFMAGATRDWTK